MKDDKGLYEVGIEMRKTRPNITWPKIEKSLEFRMACDDHDVEDYQIEFIRRGFLGLPFEDEQPVGVITIKGKYEGCPIDKAPIAYLKWALKSAVIKTKPELEKQIIEYLNNHD
jgi:hypothetical protein